jgi:hypothetical protein
MGGWSERVMGQKGFFDVERRLEAISALGDPLETIKKIVPWEDFFLPALIVSFSSFVLCATVPPDLRATIPYHDRSFSVRL